jgi:uncharacterized protein YbjT (DUF2867 family)
MAILITGATGNVGSLVVGRLLARGCRPRVFVRDGGKARGRYGNQVDVAIGDLTDPAESASSSAPAAPGADRRRWSVPAGREPGGDAVEYDVQAELEALVPGFRGIRVDAVFHQARDPRVPA